MSSIYCIYYLGDEGVDRTFA